MSKKLIFLIIIIIAVIGGILYARRSQEITTSSSPSPSASPKESPSASPTPTSGGTASPTPKVSPAQKISTITFNNNGFSPSTLRVSAGTTVVFRNVSSQDMWPASAVHPTHTVYPTTGGCIGSTFDACKNTAPGGEWSFRFDIKGTWKYHNHLNPSQTGTIVVE